MFPFNPKEWPILWPTKAGKTNKSTTVRWNPTVTELEANLKKRTAERLAAEKNMTKEAWKALNQQEWENL